jgi:hypothetical protein
MSRQTPQAVVLWALTVLLVGFALADIPLFGLDPAMMAVLAAVFAALTAVYTRDGSTNDVK